MAKLYSQNTLKMGALMPSFSLLRSDSVRKNYIDYYNGKCVLIVFMCNHCPYVIPKIQTLIDIQNEFVDSLNIVAINSNDATDYPEDSFEKMTEYAHSWGLNFDYLYDQTQKTALDFGAVCTPDLFLFDSDGGLIYHGCIDPEHRAVSDGRTLKEVLNQFLNHAKVATEQLPSLGCSIKWSAEYWEAMEKHFGTSREAK